MISNCLENTKNVLLTGAHGFVGRNLATALSRLDDVHLITFDIGDTLDSMFEALAVADIVYHLAGINRPQREEEFFEVNTELTRTMLTHLEEIDRKPVFILSSSTQACLANPYGLSKKAAEELTEKFSLKTSAPVCIYRLPNVFGKWSRPNYNSVVATFCFNIARNLDIEISDENRELELVYIDDVVAAFMRHLDVKPDFNQRTYEVGPTYNLTLGDLAERIHVLHDIQKTRVLPNLEDKFTEALYSTYLSFLPVEGFAYPVQKKNDQRGWLFELVKSSQFGQIFVSKSSPGVVRGNHYHDTKVEKFCVVEGEGVIRFRHVDTDQVVEYRVNGDEIQVVDIPPGYTHSIENIGNGDMLCIFWASQVFDPDGPDTYFSEVFPCKE